ncbi:MAG TPA: TonB family protein [Thermoanaerobaculia bacterium]|nr:TonB family protein [Thermoanaerobaculia bacterium]
MRLRAKTIEQSGSYLLLGKLESDAICETWRALDVTSEPGAAPFALRRFPHIPAAAMREAAARAEAVLPGLRGPAIARRQRIVPADGTNVLIHEHEGGRSLALISDRAKNSAGGRLPMPLDLALAITEKIALALEATHDLTYDGNQLVHGGLLPHFVWITGDGDVRVTGQELGRVTQAALEVDGTASLVRPFLAPEVVRGDSPTPLSDIYSAGSLLYLLLTGDVLPECRTSEQNIDRIQQGRSCLSGDPLDPGLQTILIRCLGPDPAARYDSAGELREAIANLLHDGSSAPTTFNLAFYLHTVLRKDFEQEQLEQKEEARIDAAGSLRPSATAAPGAIAPSSSKRTRVLYAAAAFLIVSSGIAAAYLRFAPADPPVAKEAGAVETTQTPPVVPLPVADVIAEPAMTTGEPPPLDDTAAREAAFEAAVNARLQEEMLKLQAKHDEELRRQRQAQVKPPEPRTTATPVASIQTSAAAAPEEQERRREEVGREAIPSSTPVATPLPAATPPPVTLAREGELIELAKVDRAPAVVRSVEPVYPPLARSRRIEGSVIVSALVSETGRVLEVRIMRGDSRNIGLNESAITAVRAWQFTPAMKDGQRVRTWMPVAVSFKMPK